MKNNGKLLAWCCSSVWALAIAPTACLAQVVINAPPTIIGDLFQLNAGETLNVFPGGQVGHAFRANDGSTVNISGGNVGLRFFANTGSEVNISGGNVGSIDGALVGSFSAFSKSLVNISGGTIGDEFEAFPGSEVHISGGTVGRELDAKTGSDVELAGGEFLLNGAEFTGDSITLKRFVGDESVFTGTLADGSTFVFSPLAGNRGDNLVSVTLTRVVLPASDLTPQIVTSPVTDGPSGLRAGQSLTVQTGGELRNNFAAIDAKLDVEGGTVGRNLEVAGSEVNISGGSVGDFFYAYSGSEINISGGSVGFRFEAFGSDVNISGGSVSSIFTAHRGTKLSVSAGRVGSIELQRGSELQISGGNIGVNLYRSLIASSGSKVRITGGAIGHAFSASEGSDVELIGGEFQLNGSKFTGGNITLGPEDIFTGTLSDGSSFVFSPLAGDELQSVTLTQTSLPPTDLTPMTISSPVADGPSGLRAGQTLTVKAGGVLRENFAVVDATLNMEGGAVGGGVEVAGGTVNLSGGILGGGVNFSAYVTNDFSSGFDAIDSVVNMSGGTVGERSSARRGSVFNISGGTVESKFNAFSGSEMNVSGGVFAPDFRALVGSDVELIGGEFRLNGAMFSGNTITLGTHDVFTGTLADGSTFVFSPRANPLGDELQSVTLTQIALPTIDLTPRIVDSSATGGPSGIRAGQTLTVQAGGALEDHFAAVDAVLNVEGGVVGSGLEAAGSTVNISGGTVGDLFQAYGSEVNISGGDVSHFSVHPGTTVNVTGGALASLWSFSPTEQAVVNISGEAVIGYLDAYAGSLVKMTGGTIDGNFGVLSAVATISGGLVRGALNVNNYSTVNISGGTIAGNLTTTSSSGTEINISGGSVEGVLTFSSDIEINLFGRRFLLDGILLDGLQVGKAFTITDRDVNLSGLLADGTAFSFDLNSQGSFSAGYFSPEATLTVTLLVPEPASVTLLSLGYFLFLGRRLDSTRA